MDNFDVTTRMEAKAPNLKPVVHIDAPNYICCTEAYKVPKSKLCEGSINYPPLPQLHCLHKTAPCPKRRPEPSGLHERDILFRPIRWRCKDSTKVPDQRYAPSLGSPIGLSKSSFSIKFVETDSSGQSLQAFATLLIAFAEYFITPEIEWDEKVINRILLEGQSLYADSKLDLSEGEQLQERTVKRSFVLCKNAFNVMVNDAFLIGHVVGKELPVPNLHWGLLKFFKKFQFCLLQIGSWYILLWKNADVYFVFDCFGRRTQDFQSDPRQGVAMLICLRSLDNVSHLVVNLSGIQPDQLFTIRHLQVKSLIPCGNQPLPDIVDRSVQFEIIAPDYALLRGTIHLGSKCFKEIRHRQSLPVAICALINAKIDATPTWDSAVLDKIIKLGAGFYKQWTRCDVSIDLGIQDVPRRFSFGQFIVEIAVDPISECGLWKCTPNYRHTELTVALKKAFGRGSNLLIQIQGRCYAIWKKGEFYYVMDPYSHQCSLEKKKIVTASLRMCATIDRLCCIVTQALLELFEESTFLIHVVQILQVEELDKINENRCRTQTPCRCLATAQAECSHEVMSLNESVLGPDGFECAAENSPFESDSANLDSPGLSQAHLEDYTDLRRDFMEDSSSEESEEEEDDIDLDAVSVDMPPSGGSDDDDDDDGPPSHAAPEKTRKKSKKGSGGDKKSKAATAKSEANDDNRRGNKRGHETAVDDADDEMDESERKSKRARKKDTKDDEDTTTPKTKEGKLKKPDRKENKQVDNEDKSKSNPEQNNKEDRANENEKRKAEKDKRLGQGESPPKDKEPDIIKGDTEPTLDDRRAVDQNRNENKKDENKSSPPIDQDAPPDDTGSKSDRPNDRQSKDPLPAAKTTFRRQRHQRRKEQDGDDTSSDENPRAGIPVGCKPNSYPGFTEDPRDLAVVGSESGSYESLCCLLKSAFRCADRALTMTPWGNYVTFRSNKVYFIFDGCTCNLRSIRHMDISVGTAGLLCFPDMHSLIRYIESGKETPRPTTSSKRDVVNQICSEYCDRARK